MSERAEVKQEGTAKVPFYKKKWFWITIAVVCILGFLYNLGNPRAEGDIIDSDKQSQEDQDGASSKDSSNEDSIACATSSVSNDVTGNWRILSVAEARTVDDYAVDYYKKCFESDTEIHAIVNFTYKTTTKIMHLGDLVNVTVYEYVDGEEHDAKKLFSGMVLTDKFYDVETGKEVDLD